MRKKFSDVVLVCQRDGCGKKFTMKLSKFLEKRGGSSRGKYCSPTCYQPSRKIEHKKNRLTCTKCRESKAKNAFEKDKSTVRGYRYWCKECFGDYKKEWSRDPVEISKRRNRMLLKRYGITLDEFNRILEIQNNACAGCFKPFSTENGKSNLTVDHNHRTKKVRGLLCLSCNSLLGSLGDREELLKRLADYVFDPPAEKIKESG